MIKITITFFNANKNTIFKSGIDLFVTLFPTQREQNHNQSSYHGIMSTKSKTDTQPITRIHSICSNNDFLEHRIKVNQTTIYHSAVEQWQNLTNSQRYMCTNTHTHNTTYSMQDRGRQIKRHTVSQNNGSITTAAYISLLSLLYTCLKVWSVSSVKNYYH